MLPLPILGPARQDLNNDGWNDNPMSTIFSGKWLRDSPDSAAADHGAWADQVGVSYRGGSWKSVKSTWADICWLRSEGNMCKYNLEGTLFATLGTRAR